jgi:exopolysaccharide biosynthesis polyprenyl glycosylphosphotransferase
MNAQERLSSFTMRRPTLPVTRSSRLWPAMAVATADTAAIVAAMLVALLLRARMSDEVPIGQHAILGAITLPVWLGVFSRYKLFNPPYVANIIEEFSRLVHAIGVSVLAMAAVGFMLKLDLARGWLVATFVLAVVSVVVERLVVRDATNRLRRRGWLQKPVVIVGGNKEAIALGAFLRANVALGYRVVGFIDDVEPVGQEIMEGGPVLGRLGDIVQIVRDIGARAVVIETSVFSRTTSNRLVRQLTDMGIDVELSLSIRDVATERLKVRALGRFPVVFVAPVRRHGWRAIAKRSLDIGIAAASLVLMMPLLLLVAIAVKLDSGGPVLFRQCRVGRLGKTFELYKFRTMVPDAERLLRDLLSRNEADGPLFKIRNDPRTTRIGQVLRRYSLDEWPQLWNVLRGDMSLVGPRPALPSEIGAWSQELHHRLRVKPGITGMWQVNGRSDASFEEYIRHDLYYVDNWSLLTDLAILARTAVVILRRRGAY